MLRKRSVLLIGILIVASLAFVGCMGADGRPASVQGNIYLEGAPWHRPVVIEVDGEFKGIFENGTYAITGLESGYITLSASTEAGSAYYETSLYWRISGGQNKHDIKFESLWSKVD